MRVWHTYLFVFLLAVGVRVTAQTPTATPHPNALPPGMYQFEDLSSPEMELTGSDWSIRIFGGGDTGDTGLGSDDDGDTLTFWVTENADYILIYRKTTSSSTGEWSICVDATCQNAQDKGGGGGLEPYAVDLFETNSEVVITKTNGNESIFDFMTIILDPNSIQAVSGTSSSSPTATPEPYYIYDTISGVSGTVATRFDMVVTAGDVAISNALIFLFFSLWAIFLILVIGKD